MLFTAAEIVCVKRLAALFEKGESIWNSYEWEKLGLTAENHFAALSTMEHCRAITEAVHGGESDFGYFVISVASVQLARQIEEQEKKNEEGKDIMEHVKATLRKHPVAGYAVVIFVGLTALLATVNSVITFCQNVGLIKK